MKKYMLLTAATIAVVSWILLIPGLTVLSSVSVTVKRAAIGRTATTVECTGTLQAAAQQTVVYGCPVMTKKAHVQAGDTVKKGQLLVELDQKQTAAAFATITAAQSSSSSGGDDSNSDSSSSSDSDTNAALQQYLDGQGGDAGSLLSEYYDSSADSSATVPTDSGSADDASLHVPDAVYADFSGVVTAVNAADGTFTQPTVPLVVVSDTSHMQVKAQVDESLISSVKAGQKAHISSSAFDGVFHGTVAQIAPTAHSVLTGTTSTKTVVDVTLDIQDANSKLKGGMDADTSILVSNDRSISLPYEALQQDPQNRLYVMTVRKGKAARQNVTTGTEHTDSVDIRSGVRSGDLVILNPPSSLHSGQPVHVASGE